AVDHARASTTASPAVVGEMLTYLTVTRDSVDALFDASADLTFAPSVEHTAEVLARKTNAAESAIATVRRALDVCGGAGYSRTVGLERLYRDVHGALYHPLPLDKQRAFTGRVALGLDPIGG
ncbi:MAG: acyl-CoA dehydrogenase family protein, partial [Actinomycetota bacterium]